MTRDNRKEKRSAIVHSTNHSFFHIEVFDEQYQLERIHDVSLSGIGIQLAYEIPRGTYIRMMFCDKSLCRSTSGKIAWSDPILDEDETDVTQPMRFRSGIEFNASDNYHTSFFDALKQLLKPQNKIGCLE